jgi:hypothetical protein
MTLRRNRMRPSRKGSAAEPDPPSVGRRGATQGRFSNADCRGGESYTGTTPIDNPGSHPGISTTFSNRDRPAAAVAAPASAKSTTDGYVHAVPENKAFFEFEFDGPPNALVGPDFVTDAGRKQDAAIKKGLTG